MNIEQRPQDGKYFLNPGASRSYLLENFMEISLFEKKSNKLDFPIGKDFSQSSALDLERIIKSLSYDKKIPRAIEEQGRTPVVDEFGYMLIKDSAKREQLLARTVAMIMQMSLCDVNTIVFCDRGARPLSTLIGALWDQVSSLPRPAFFFINTDPKRQFQADASDVPAENLAEIQELAAEYPDGYNPLREGGANVCVVDETKQSGRSAQFVANLVQKAFPGVQDIYCDWANVIIPWNNNSEMIGAETVPGKFRSRELATDMARLLAADLRRLGESYQQYLGN